MRGRAPFRLSEVVFFFFGFLGYLASGGFVLDSCGKDVRGCFLGGEGN